MVEEVEELPPKAKPNLLCETELPLKRDISLPGSNNPQHIAPEIALPQGVSPQN